MWFFDNNNNNNFIFKNIKFIKDYLIVNIIFFSNATFFDLIAYSNFSNLLIYYIYSIFILLYKLLRYE